MPGGEGRSLVPFSPSLPRGKSFLHLTKARFSLEIKIYCLCFEEKRQQQLLFPQQLLSKSSISRLEAGSYILELE